MPKKVWEDVDSCGGRFVVKSELPKELRQLYELDDFGPSEAVETYFRGKSFADSAAAKGEGEKE